MTEIEKNIIKLYSEDKLSSLKIARQLGVSPSKVLTTLSKFCIPKRDFLAGFIVFGGDWDKKFNKRFFKTKLL